MDEDAPPGVTSGQRAVRWLRLGSGLAFGLAAAWLLLGVAGPSPAHGAAGTPTPVFVWPISGNATPDLPQSSAYGPRLQASAGFRYDYHQGLDLPTAVSTTLLAVSTGTVRIAGAHPSYSDGVVQLDHGHGLYSNYLHISASLVTTGQAVLPGQPVALSGVSESGFPHLHFEIRQGSVNRRDAINPLRYLPYANAVTHTVAITEVTADRGVWVRVTTPADELDFSRLTVTVRSLAGGEVLEARTLDYEARNRAYDGDPAVLDQPDLDGILISPLVYGSTSTLYVVDVLFHALNAAGAVQVEACAYDVRERGVCASAQGAFDRRLYLPVINR